jgi:capsular polysaccharide export protein
MPRSAPDAHAARVICMLQGPSGGFFWRLRARLQARGVRVVRVNLCAGDRLDWPGPAFDFRDTPQHWPMFIERLMREEGVTDLLLLGEQRDYHRVAIAAARRLGVTVAVCELGYLRPDWLTLELDGMSAHSRFPREPAQIRAAAAGVPAPDDQRRFDGGFVREAVADVAYHLANLAFGWRYPHYRSHLPGQPVWLDLGIGLHMLRDLATRPAMTRRCARLATSARPFFLMPLQIESDFQIRAYSRYASVGDALREVVASFARHAPAHAHLAIKAHPREVVWRSWRRLAGELARAGGVADRVHYLDGGDLDRLIAASRGVVTVNSTVGLQALQRGRPVKTLGAAVYDVAGMTHGGDLDSFWSDPVPPDAALVRDFIALLAVSIQVRGSFYSRAGSAAALDEFAERLASGGVNRIRADA